MSYEELREEFKSEKFRNVMKIELGTQCVNCNSTKNIQYHHIVPLIVGGTNRMENIVPVCDCCHKSIHYGQNITCYRKKTNNLKGGRKRKYAEQQRSILDKFFNCEIGTSECKKLLCMPESSKIKDTPIVKEYMKDNDISSSRNNIDVILKNGKQNLKERCVVFIQDHKGNKKLIYKVV